MVTDPNRDFSNPMYELGGAGEGVQPAAVLAPSSVQHQLTPPPLPHRELSPAQIDTGKDTQRLVAEDDSEC